ncbi:hypothetical protein IAT40_007500 [Kwoniella sp. CBS 6097]
MSRDPHLRPCHHHHHLQPQPQPQPQRQQSGHDIGMHDGDVDTSTIEEHKAKSVHLERSSSPPLRISSAPESYLRTRSDSAVSDNTENSPLTSSSASSPIPINADNADKSHDNASCVIPFATGQQRRKAFDSAGRKSISKEGEGSCTASPSAEGPAPAPASTSASTRVHTVQTV